jgi:hypothetical protein
MTDVQPEPTPGVQPASHGAPQRPTSTVGQQLLAERDRLDRALARFERLHAFTLRALAARESAALRAEIAEGVVEVIESEVGLVWRVDAERLATEHGLSGASLSAEALQELGAWALRTLAESPGEDTLLLGGEPLVGLAASLPLVDVLIAGGRSADGELTVVLLAGNTARSARFHEPLTAEHLESLSLLAQQASAMFERHRVTAPDASR